MRGREHVFAALREGLAVAKAQRVVGQRDWHLGPGIAALELVHRFLIRVDRAVLRPHCAFPTHHPTASSGAPPSEVRSFAISTRRCSGGRFWPSFRSFCARAGSATAFSSSPPLLKASNASSSDIASKMSPALVGVLS